MQDLIKLLPDGASVVAVIVVIVLFLKQQEKVNQTFEAVTRKFHETECEGRVMYQNQLVKLEAQQTDSQKHYQDQIHALIEAHLNVSKEMITAIKELELSLKEVINKSNIK